MSGESLEELRALAKPLGYDVANASFVGEPGSWYSVFPLDRPDDGNPLATADEARGYIEGIASARRNR